MVGGFALRPPSPLGGSGWNLSAKSWASVDDICGCHSLLGCIANKTPPFSPLHLVPLAMACEVALLLVLLVDILVVCCYVDCFTVAFFRVSFILLFVVVSFFFSIIYDCQFSGWFLSTKKNYKMIGELSEGKKKRWLKIWSCLTRVSSSNLTSLKKKKT